MTQEERLKTCKLCKNRKFDRTKGLVCGLTMEAPAFVNECRDYVENPKAVAIEVGRHNFRGEGAHYSTRLDTASAGKRFANLIIDGILRSLIAFVLIFFMIGPGMFRSPFSPHIFSFVIAMVYYSFFEMVTGQSPGKMVTGTVVVNEDGTTPDGGRILIRSLCRFIPFNAFSFLGDGVGWHDTISKTRVVEKSSIQNQKDDEVLDQF